MTNSFSRTLRLQHATSAVDYRLTKEMRMAATVYVADISEDNIDAILSDYTQKKNQAKYFHLGF